MKGLNQISSSQLSGTSASRGAPAAREKAGKFAGDDVRVWEAEATGPACRDASAPADMAASEAVGLGTATDVLEEAAGRETTEVHPRGADADPPTARLALAGLDEDGARLPGGPALHEGACDPLMLRKSASLPRLGGGAAEAIYAERVGDGMRVSRRRRSWTLFERSRQ